ACECYCGGVVEMGAAASQGTYAHKDGYNCLYGDYHVQWYGDPDKRLIWMPPPNDGSCVDMFYCCQMCINYGNVPGSLGYNALRAWHMFDNRQGLDPLYEEEY